MPGDAQAARFGDYPAGRQRLDGAFFISAYDIANGAGVLVDIVQKSAMGLGDAAPQVLLLAPPPTTTLTDFAEMFEGAGTKSRRFAEHYARAPHERGCAFLDTGQVIVSSELDGIHLEAIEQPSRVWRWWLGYGSCWDREGGQ